MKNSKEQFIVLCAALAISSNTHATLLGITQAYPDVTLNQNYLIYDNDAIDSNTDLLKLVSYDSTLNEGPAAGNSTLTQSYSGPGDPYPNLMLAIAINRNTGNWVSTTRPGANKVSIGFGKAVIPDGSANTPGFSWQGNIPGFGWQEDVPNTSNNESGTFFDASWTFTNDNYEDMPSNLVQFTDGSPTNAMAAYQDGIKISNSAGFGAVSHTTTFQRDWVSGANANTLGIQNLLSPLSTGLSTTVCSSSNQTDCTSFVHSSVTADVFVPAPSALWLWTGTLTALPPFVKRHKNHSFYWST